jgi:hypothetical protein
MSKGTRKLTIRVPVERQEVWAAAARAAGRTLVGWIREALDAKAGIAAPASLPAEIGSKEFLEAGMVIPIGAPSVLPVAKPTGKKYGTCNHCRRCERTGSQFDPKACTCE